MKITKTFRFGAFMLILMSVVVFAGCSWFGSKNDPEAQKKVHTAMVNLSKIDSGNYELSMDGDVTSTKKNESEFKKISGSMNMSGGFDSTKKDDLKLSLKIAVNGNKDGGAEQGIEGELRLLNKNTLYFMFSKISDFGDAGQGYKQVVDMFVNKWWSVEVPKEMLAQVNLHGYDESNMTPQEKQLKELYENTMLFTDVKYKGDEKVGTVDTEYYTMALDKEALKTYLTEVSKIMGQDVTGGQLSQIEDFLKRVEFKGNIWINKADQAIKKLSGGLNVADDGNVNMEIDLNLTYTLDNLGGTVVIEAPKDAQQFDPLMLLSGMSALPAK